MRSARRARPRGSASSSWCLSLESDEELDAVERRRDARSLERVAVEEERRVHALDVLEPVGSALDVALLLLRAEVVVRRELVVAEQQLPAAVEAELRRGPHGPALRIDLRRGARRPVRRLHHVEAGVDPGMLVRDLAVRALLLVALHVVVVDDEARHAQPFQKRAAEGEGAERGADLDGFLVVRLRARVRLAVVDAGVHVAIVAGEVVVAGEAGVRGADEARALREDGALEAVAVDVLRVVD